MIERKHQNLIYLIYLINLDRYDFIEGIGSGNLLQWHKEEKF